MLSTVSSKLSPGRKVWGFAEEERTDNTTQLTVGAVELRADHGRWCRRDFHHKPNMAWSSRGGRLGRAMSKSGMKKVRENYDFTYQRERCRRGRLSLRPIIEKVKKD